MWIGAISEPGFDRVLLFLGVVCQVGLEGLRRGGGCSEAEVLRRKGCGESAAVEPVLQNWSVWDSAQNER